VLRRALIAIIVAIILISQCIALSWDSDDFWQTTASGGDMAVSTTWQSELISNGDSVTKNFNVQAQGTGVQSMGLLTKSQYAEEKDGIIYQTGGEIYQQLVAPGNIQVHMDNDHQLDYSNPSNYDQNLATNMNVFGPSGESLISLQTTSDSDIEEMIDKSLENVEQSWYQTFGDGGEFSGGIDYNKGDLAVTIGYIIPTVAAKDNLVCSYGHAHETTKTIEIY